jgi:adenylate cyclase
MSGDKEQELFSDGLTDEIINAVAKLRNVFVIARNSTFTYKGKNVTVQQVGEEMGVRYVLQGTVRRTGDKVRVTAQLADATTGQEIMSERYERNLKNIFALQDEITMNVLSAMRVALTEGDMARQTAKGTKNLEAYLKVMQATQLRFVFNKQAFARAQQLAEEAIALDPRYAMAYSVLALVLGNETQIGLYQEPREILEKAKAYGEKAVALDDTLGHAHIALSYSLLLSREYERGVYEAQRGFELEPGSAQTNAYMGTTFLYTGQYEQAIPMFRNALRLSPVPIATALTGLGTAYRSLGQYGEAIPFLTEAKQREPDNITARLGLASTYMLAGRESEARAEAVEVLRINPNFSLEKFVNSSPMKNRTDLMTRFIEPLRKAGLK